MHVAVVRDRQFPGAGAAAPERPIDTDLRTEDVAAAIAEELHDAGHTAMVCEGDEGLLPMLRDFMPHRHRCPTGIVFNLVRRTAGEDQRAHIPALLEMAGVAYTGPTPLGHVLTLDRSVVRAILLQAGIPTLQGCVARYGGEVPPEFRFPLIVRSRDVEPEAGSRLIHSREQLERALDDVTMTRGREAVVEQYVEGIDVIAALVGNEADLQVLALLDEDGENSLVSGGARPPIQPALAGAIREMALTAFGACRCQDYALVRFRVDDLGRPFVVEVDSMPALETASSFTLAAASAGYSRAALVERLVDVAYARYFGVSAPRFELAARAEGAWRGVAPAGRRSTDPHE